MVKKTRELKKFRVMAFWGPSRPTLDTIHIFANDYEVEDEGKTVSFYDDTSRVASVASWVSVEMVGKEE